MKIINLLKDIKKFLKDDTEHYLKVEVDSMGVTVYLDYDPDSGFEEDCVIPIYYDNIENFCYIPHDKYCEMFRPADFGMDFTEIKIIKDIMQYLENHKQEINELCDGYSFKDREVYKKKNDNV